MASYTKLVDQANNLVLVFSHNFGDREQVKEVVYYGSSEAEANLALIKKLIGANSELWTVADMSAALTGVNTPSAVETYVHNNKTEIDDEAVLLDR